MVSAICPNCNILLVEATTASTANLGTAVNRAVTMGAKFVSNSYGGPETGSENELRLAPTTTTPASRSPPAPVTATTTAVPTRPPARTSPRSAALARPQLQRPRLDREGVEHHELHRGRRLRLLAVRRQAARSRTASTTGCAKRAEADVSAVADPATGVAVYQTYGGSGWAVYGGTSAAAPIIASVYALAGTPGASDDPNTYPYAHTGNLNDVTTGSNGTCGAPLCTAGAGWDGPTGLGTPNGAAAFKAGGGATRPSASPTPVQDGHRRNRDRELHPQRERRHRARTPGRRPASRPV